MVDAPAKAVPETKAEERKTCAGCNKPMKKLIKYYRNGKYYCNRKCWSDKRKKEQAPAETSTEASAKE